MSLSADIRSTPPGGPLLRRRLWTAAVVLIVFVLAGVLYRFPPTEHSFYPTCWFHTVTGLHCPGCGGTRCAYALLHGDLGQAAAFNIMVLVYLPYVAVTAFNACWHAIAGRPLLRGRLPAWTIKVTFVLLILFWILRNLPFAPFTLLAPHKL
jgi:hypothetical protein